MSARETIVYLVSHSDPPPEATEMRFRLVYEGPISSRQKDPETGKHDPLAPHVQSIRKAFHEQLKELWRTNHFLSSTNVDFDWSSFDKSPLELAGKWDDGPKNQAPLWLALAENYKENGYRFVPLVRKAWRLECTLDILLLRRDNASAVISAGDLDNRVKTLIDGLRKPEGANELRGNEKPEADEDPFYVLLEDDALISGLTVRTDQLLVPEGSTKIKDAKEAYAVIEVNIRPLTSGIFTFGFL